MSQAPSSPLIDSDSPPSQEDPAAKKWANSFESDEAMLEGVKNIRQKLQLQQVEYPSVEAAESDYVALTKVMRSPTLPNGSAPAKEVPEDQSVSIPRSEPAAGISDVLSRVGLSSDGIIDQWHENGSLTDEQYQKIQSSMPGISKGVINDFIEGQFAVNQNRQFVQNQILSRSVEIAGGPNGTKEDLDAVLIWAKNLPQDDQNDFNERLSDPRRYERAVRELVREYRAAGGSNPNPAPLAQGGTTPVMSNSVAITTRSEYDEALAKAARGDQASKTSLLNLSSEMKQKFRS